MMRARGIGSAYQVAARIWLSAAGLSFLLPTDRRLGLWLPAHLALAGAVSLAISGAMQGFAAALTAAPDPPRRLPVAQLALLNIGAALIAYGYPTGHPLVVAIGGVAFGLAMALLAFIVWRMWSRSINRRHPVPMLAYAAALTSVLTGVTIGALIGSRAITGSAWLALRQAHMVVNVLGWATLTIIGTVLTLIPTLLRVRMPAWHPLPVVAAAAGSVGTLALGLAIDARWVASAGALLLAVASLGVAWLIMLAVRTPRRHHVPLAAKHIIAGLAWFIGGSVALAIGMARSNGSPVLAFASMRDTFLLTFVGGWILQVLLGAWLYLLPMQRPAMPDERKRLLAGVELIGSVELVALNGGLVVMALAPSAVEVGAWIAAAGVAIALGKAWLFPRIARSRAAERRAEILWAPVPGSASERDRAM